MPIDPSIALGYKAPEIEKPENALLKLLQVDGLMNKADEYRTGVQRKNRLYNVLSENYSSPETRENALLRNGFIDEASKLGKDRRDNAKADADISAAHWKLLGDMTNLVAADPRAATVDGVLNQWEKLTGQSAATTRASFAQFGDDPQKIREMALRFNTAAKDQLMKIQNTNLGGTSLTQGVDPVNGRVTTLAQNEITQSPDSAASVAASRDNAAATREVARATRDAANVQRDRETEMKLGDDYRAQSKGFKDVGDAYRQINSTLGQATQSPAATLAAATKFMKLLDPGSVVRESELGMALAASGVIDRAANYVETLRKGKVLNPTQVADFKNITQQIYAAAQAGQKQIDAAYRKQAQAYGLRPELVLQDLGQNAPSNGPTVSNW